MPECVIDGRPTDVALCRGCLDQLLLELRSVGWLTQQLTVTLTRQARAGERNGSRSAETPLPYHHGASVDLESLLGGLMTWALEICRTRGVTLDAEPTPPSLAKWLLLWEYEMASHPAAERLYDEITSLVRAGRRTIDRHPDMRYLGPCDDCQADLYAPVHAVVVACRGERDDEPCTARYPIAERRAWLLEQAADQLRTARQLANELPWIAGITITAERISMWARRGKITEYLPHVHDERQAKRYRVGEVIDCARRMATEKVA